VHSRLTGELVSTLSARSTSESGSSAARRLDVVHTEQVTALALHPANPLQLVSASLDGTLKIWDVLDATLLRSLDVGLPITHMALHASQPGVAYVAVRKPKSNGPSDKTDPFNFTGESAGAVSLSASLTSPRLGRTNSIIYSVALSSRNTTSAPKEANGSGSLVSLKASTLLRIGKTRDAAALAVSPDGQWLVAIGNRKVQVARLASLRDGFVKYVSDERLVSLAFHPHDGTFATGDVAGKIRIWYCLNTDASGVSGASAFSAAAQVTGVEKHATSTLLHWHAHAVSGLAYAPNGAYLLSGGEEAVLVLWQLQTGQREYVPRLGAPIASVAVAGGLEGRELEYVVGLADGSTTFVSAVNLKPLRSFARVKIGE
jgi:NET1-associated nuclear protein 1 (U3 small nucleolar RNA-associated protein 17)